MVAATLLTALALATKPAGWHHVFPLDTGGPLWQGADLITATGQINTSTAGTGPAPTAAAVQGAWRTALVLVEIDLLTQSLFGFFEVGGRAVCSGCGTE